MLYNPAWSKPVETKPDPLLDKLIAFLERQPSGKVYIFDWPDECLIAQCFGTELSYQATRYHPVLGQIFRLAADGERTMGAALARARAIKHDADLFASVE